MPAAVDAAAAAAGTLTEGLSVTVIHLACFVKDNSLTA